LKKKRLNDTIESNILIIASLIKILLKLDRHELILFINFSQETRN